ncbi:hypothetical protein [Muriicola marianensis]|uniref:Uncharacterized protein n=1 Tax=Muriicola marianensis TaxID=1324801 RepID=A0ABQ1R5I9_9FLAO|nr:hypothetical protein [Muriicola marianensis]GGD55620.1 hypothetical protein GCM10011361_22650 [Muriicola marianensis]
MKRPYVLYFLLVIISIIFTWSCTNDEGDNDLDILTPNDTTQAVYKTTEIPK